ncbi:unnamed protein product [Musa acuminata subsp. malaccensis]|uniref:(wild Malaysian banana) hypothetical protein n=1 Tax=Musa acuminata subsp. malaccensis TaxID=214687 RepID=A0A8D7AMJ1_MUSAM|nr:unnamed protein product [Musa acuminata subsp. malaccensis]
MASPSEDWLEKERRGGCQRGALLIGHGRFHQRGLRGWVQKNVDEADQVLNLFFFFLLR